MTTRKQFDKAIPQLQRATTLERKDWRHWYNLGVARAANKQLPEARLAYEEATARNRDSVRAQYNLGIVLLDLGESSKAAERFQIVTQLRPKYARAHFFLGVALKAVNQRAQARISFRQAHELDSRLAKLQFALGRHYVKAKQFRDAHEAFENTLELDPTHLDAHRWLGDSLLKNTNRFLEANIHLAIALSIMDKKLTDFRKGVTSVENANEAAVLANFALVRKNQPWIAGKLFVIAYRSKSLRADLRQKYRYNAACAFLRVAARKVESGVTLPASNFERYQRQSALNLLTADLKVWRRAIKSSERLRVSGLRQLRHWQVDPDLTDVRDTALRKLPANEQADWQRLWLEVATVLKSEPVAARRP